MVNRRYTLAACLLICLAMLRPTTGQVFTQVSFQHPQPTAAPLAEPPAVMLLKPAPSPVVIDARLDDAAWQQAEPFSDFVVFRTPVPAEQQRQVRMSFDEQNLYVAVRLQKKPGYILKANTRTDGDTHMWEDDGVELFVDPGLNYNEYYQIIINASGNYVDLHHINRWEQDPAAAEAGVLHQVRQTDADWTSQVEFAVDPGKPDDEWWTIELRLPASAFGLPGIPLGARWGVNIASNNPHTNQLTNWIPGDWHNPFTYGQILLGEPQLDVRDGGFGSLAAGANLFQAVVTNLTDQAGTYRLHLRVHTPDEQAASQTTASLSLPARASTTAGLVYVIPQSASQAHIVVQVYDQTDNLVYQSTRTTTQLHPRLSLQVKPYGYFSDQPYVTGQIELNLGDVELGRTQLHVTLQREQTVLAQQTLKPTSPLATFNLATADLSPGIYQLSVELVGRAGQRLEQTHASFALTSSPFATH